MGEPPRPCLWNFLPRWAAVGAYRDVRRYLGKWFELNVSVAAWYPNLLVGCADGVSDGPWYPIILGVSSTSPGIQPAYLPSVRPRPEAMEANGIWVARVRKIWKIQPPTPYVLHTTCNNTSPYRTDICEHRTWLFAASHGHVSLGRKPGSLSPPPRRPIRSRPQRAHLQRIL